MKTFRLQLGVIVLVVIAVGSALAARRPPKDDETDKISVGGTERSYILHVPESLPAGKSVPLVLVFHGGGGHAATMPKFTGFDQQADRAGFIVAYPEGLNTHWSDTRGLSPADDVGFIRALVAEVERSHSIDPKRVYATGISNGGFFSNRLACDLTDKIAAIASVAATMPETLMPVCKPSRPISVMFIHGTKDPLVPIEGGAVAHTHGMAVSLQQASEFWRSHDMTSPKAVIENLPDTAHDGTSVHRESYGGGKQGTEVVVYTIANGGHTWPGGPQYLPSLLVGKASRNLDATSVIWEFFSKHRLE